MLIQNNIYIISFNNRTPMFAITFDNILLIVGYFAVTMAISAVYILTNDIVEKFINKIIQLKTTNVALVAEVECLREQNASLAKARDEQARVLVEKFDEVTSQAPRVDYDANANLLIKENSRLLVKCEMLEKELEHLRVGARPNRLARMDSSYPSCHNSEKNSDEDDK